MSVYRVTEIIGTSPTSWEEAAKEALAAAAGSLRDLRVAEVLQQDIALAPDGALESFRTKLRVSFKYEAQAERTQRAGQERVAQPAQ
jgi:flavin-binding protein dodecin